MDFLLIAIVLRLSLVPETTAADCASDDECSGCNDSTYKKFPICAKDTCVCNAISTQKVCTNWSNCSQSACAPIGKIRSCQYGICTCKDCEVGREGACSCKFGRSCVKGTCVCKDEECKSDAECPECSNTVKKYTLCARGECVCNAIPIKQRCSWWTQCNKTMCEEIGQIPSCQHGICTCKGGGCKSNDQCPACSDTLKKYPLCERGNCRCCAIPTLKTCSSWVNCNQSDCTGMGKIRSCQYGICTCKDCSIGRERECDCKFGRRCVAGTCECKEEECRSDAECPACNDTIKKYPLCLRGECVCNAISTKRVCSSWRNCNQSHCTELGKIRSCQYGVCTCKDCVAGRVSECDCTNGRSCVEGTCVCKAEECKSDTECPACNDTMKKYTICTRGECVCNALPTTKMCSSWANCNQAACTTMGKIRSCQHGICTCKNCTIGRELECGCKGKKSCVNGSCQCSSNEPKKTNENET